jgi:tight adherence protein B
MSPLAGITVFLVVLLAGAFLSNAIIGLIQTARGYDEEAVRRRLATNKGRGDLDTHVEIVRRRSEDAWYRHLPLQAQLAEAAAKAGPETTLGSIWLQLAIYSAFAFVLLALLLPIQFLLLTLVLAPVAGFALLVLNLRMKAKRRVARFEAQLPDALDLMARSLRVGHPVSGAMAVIARELPAPIGPEFAIACEEVTYGHDVPTAIQSMTKRVPLRDLGFLNVLFQVQQESGGNLIESLDGLSKVIRERHRMFRKVKSLTVEGRVSAWILSLAPVGLIFGLRLVKPDYFEPIMKLESFPLIVFVLVLLLILNVLMMRQITRIEV